MSCSVLQSSWLPDTSKGVVGYQYGSVSFVGNGVATDYVVPTGLLSPGFSEPNTVVFAQLTSYLSKPIINTLDTVPTNTFGFRNGAVPTNGTTYTASWAIMSSSVQPVTALNTVP